MKMKKFDKDIVAVKILINENLQDVKRFLSDVSPEKCFWFRNEVIVKNVQELPEVLENIDDETFSYHVNEEKNDIAKWVQDVIQDKELARSIEKLKKRDSIVKRIRGRIEYLNNINKG